MDVLFCLYSYRWLLSVFISGVSTHAPKHQENAS